MFTSNKEVGTEGRGKQPHNDNLNRTSGISRYPKPNFPGA